MNPETTPYAPNVCLTVSAEYTITTEGPFAFNIEDGDGRDFFLQCDGGVWRLSNVGAPWIGHAKVNKWEALKRAIERIEENADKRRGGKP